MSVFFVVLRYVIFEVFYDFMINEDSEIIDFYLEEFDIDLNGKKMLW